MESPAPQRIGDANIVDFGYTNTVTLLVPMHASSSLTTDLDHTNPQRFGATCAYWCAERFACPERPRCQLSIPVKASVGEPDTQTRELFAAARKSLPQAAPRGWMFRVTHSQDNFVLHANLGRQTRQAAFFPLVESQDR